MRRYALTFLVLVLTAATAQAGQPGKKGSDIPAFIWGAKVGFQANGTYLSNAMIDGHNISDYIQDSQVGNFAALQLRWNSERFLIQTGVGISHNKSAFSVDRNSWDPQAESKDEFMYSYSMTSLMVPLQVGFHFINQSSYCMSVFTGPRLRYVPDNYYSMSITNSTPYSFTEKPNNLLVGWTAGLSVQIGRTFLDFEYEATISTISKSLVDTSGSVPAPDYRLNRRLGIISFSYGIMF
ncbi:MAG: outer membrane beta-barrel protein [Bacteroidaceae bacterium]